MSDPYVTCSSMNPMVVDLQAIQQALKLTRAELGVTPLVHSTTLSDQTDTELFLKLENLQFTSSFKERGAINKLNALTDDEKSRGIVAMSAGNHAQAVARHARNMNIPATIVMPRTTPNSKIMQTRFFEPTVVLEGTTYDETLDHALKLQTDNQLTMVHPFDDPLVIAGQGTIGLELLEQQPDLDAIVVPIGGGGLISGIAIAVKAINPRVRVVGVQSEIYSAAYSAFNDLSSNLSSKISVAEGIAVKHPGDLTMSLIDRYVDEIVTVKESDIELAIFKLLEIEKTLVEGAGAAALAAVVNHREVMGGKTAAIVSGGNIDMSTLSSVIQRGLVRSRRVVRVQVALPDIPGALHRLTHVVSNMDGNILDIFHRRSFGDSTIGATIVEMVVQLRGELQTDDFMDGLDDLDYDAKLLDY